MDTKKISSLSRPLDTDYPDNRLIVLLCAMIFIASVLFRMISGDNLLPGIIWSARDALSVFFAWALTKEIDPDHPESAIIAAGVGISGLFLFNYPNLLIALLLVFLFRMVNRTVGVPLTLYDSILIVITGIYLVYTGKWMYGIVMSIAFFMDAILTNPVKRHFLFASISLIAGLFGFYMKGIEIDLISGYYIIVLLLLALFFIFRIVLAGKSHSISDRSGDPLSDKRILVTCIVALIAGLLAVLEGLTSIAATFPLWAAISGATVFDISQKLLKLTRY
ncbi:MAG: hypothetical protein Q8J68_08470 [Methanolobus sp.]|uniref:hypothetical protein n=1 Tax=Methanolobus sp. TaxID=1874737 RepID=UPI002730169E|nr:hypothetical protein [Methanolobus sp.]MDP2217304.1 hypothetical protein [Methanolobus sp.]